jgi:putative nucleotidyltransferase with HDIG domain
VAPSRREWAWYSLLFGSGTALWAWALDGLWGQSWPQVAIWSLGGLGILTFVTLFREVRLSEDDYHSIYTLDDVPLYALIFLQGWQSAAVIAGVSRFFFEAVRLARALKQHPERVHWGHVIYQFSNVPMAINVAAVAGLSYSYLNGGDPLLQSTRNALALCVATGLWFFFAFAQNALALTFRRQLPLRWMLNVLRQNLRHVRLHVLMLVPLGALLAVFLQTSPWAALLLAVPVSLMHNALEAQHKLRLESAATIQAVAQYLEERDPYTQGHSARVAKYAVALAESLGLAPDEVEQVRRAGLIHDIGKVDIPDSILRKPGHLTAVEREIMRTHTDRAVDLGRKLLSLSRELPFREAAYHHENFDGSGHYQLVADQIPLVSRILAVADTFDAMTSDRPYRRGRPLQEALQELKAAAGTQLDPACVEAFQRAVEAGSIEIQTT